VRLLPKTQLTMQEMPAEEACSHAKEIDSMATEAANRAVEANERVKVIEAKLTAAIAEPA
jgi:hypothetical protein